MIINSLKFRSVSIEMSMLYSPKILLFILSPYVGLCCIFIFSTNIVLGQQLQQSNIINTFESTTANISLFNVKFSATDPTKVIPLNKDFAPHDLHSDVAWKVASVQNGNPQVSPVAFCSGATPKVFASFDNCEGDTWVKGVGPNGFLAPAQKLVVLANSPKGRYNSIALVDAATNTPKTFTPNKAQFYEEFVITWYYSSTENGPWTECGKSAHPLYVTRSEMNISDVYLETVYFNPENNIEGHKKEHRYHSLYYYSCKYATGLSSDMEIVENIFQNIFTSLKLKRIDDPPANFLGYWRTEGDYCHQPHQYVGGLLSNNNGVCGDWGIFFLMMLNIQGITRNTSLTATPNGMMSTVSVVYQSPNPWEPTFTMSPNDELGNKFKNDIQSFFGTQDQMNVVEYNTLTGEGSPFLLLPPTTKIPTNIFVKNHKTNANKFYLWNKEYYPYPNQAEVPHTIANGNTLTFAPQPGVEGQGNPNPQSTFQNHLILKFEPTGKVYDPSYGKTYSSFNEWENGSLDCFGTTGETFKLTLRVGNAPNPVTYRRLMWRHSKNTTEQQAYFITIF